ncbi:sensor histidine kinase [Streptomyces sp. ISL-22]|uniref:sensor histidine kinase n=1 Tax=unclassified Streptomyces TaxID=2593676 RepID=UPI001BECFFF8|nr:MULTISPECIES: sensor histidine kinase [unclassified Streptomyces]MBT2418804.1 sensor histidine kinase [Streptomyces sp. ISL-24]MBT2431429.1 sensor histidine kinase [Streptomyces sp. ISL-22]
MDGSRITRERLVDAAVAVVVGAIVVLVARAGGRDGSVDLALIAVGSLALAARRTAPRVVLAVTTACLLAEVVHAGPSTIMALPVVGAVHTAGRTGYRGTAAAAAAVFLGGYVAAGSASASVAREALLLAGWFLCAVVTGLADSNWQAYLRQTEQRALEAERTREEAALRRAGEERLRIARDLHDSLTHSISIVKLQAGVAVHLARKRGEEIPPALLAIQEASGEAMRELRATLEVLRTDEPTGTPALLVERARAAGLAVELAVTGEERPLAATVDRAMYRIVQEALTNAARHAGPAKVVVRLGYADGELTIDVEDDGTADPSSPPAPGIGLTGMRERVTALGGTLDAGPRADGGFAVRARLPLGEAA